MISADSWDFLPFSLIFPELTPKEVDTVMWLYMHFNTENIATLTNVHVDVLRKRLRKIMKKLNVYSKVELEAVVGRRVFIFTFCPETKAKIITKRKSDHIF